MDGDLKETGTPQALEVVSQIAESASAATAAASGVEAAGKITAAQTDGTPAREILEATADGVFFGGGSRDATDADDDQPEGNVNTPHDADVAIEQPEDIPPPTPTQHVEEILPHEERGEPEESAEEDEEPIERPLSPDEIAMNAEVTKAKEAIQHLKAELMVIKSALDFIPQGLTREQRQEKLDMLKIKDRFVGFKTTWDTFTAGLHQTKERYLDSPDFERYIPIFEAIELEGEKARQEAAVSYRKTFNLQPNIRPIIQAEDEKGNLAFLRIARNRIREPLVHSFDTIAVKRGWGKDVDTLFELTEKEKTSVVHAYQEANKETNKHRRDQILEIGIMGLMMTLHEIESMAAEAKQQANARHAA